MANPRTITSLTRDNDHVIALLEDDGTYTGYSIGPDKRVSKLISTAPFDGPGMPSNLWREDSNFPNGGYFWLPCPGPAFTLVELIDHYKSSPVQDETGAAMLKALEGYVDSLIQQWPEAARYLRPGNDRR